VSDPERDGLIAAYREQVDELITARATHADLLPGDDDPNPDAAYATADDYRNYTLADATENAADAAIALADYLLRETATP
jgi:hypothetical protein